MCVMVYLGGVSVFHVYCFVCFVGVVIDKCHLCSFLFVLYVVLSASVWCVVCDVWLRVVGSLLCGVLCVH